MKKFCLSHRFHFYFCLTKLIQATGKNFFIFVWPSSYMRQARLFNFYFLFDQNSSNSQKYHKWLDWTNTAKISLRAHICDTGKTFSFLFCLTKLIVVILTSSQLILPLSSSQPLSYRYPLASLSYRYPLASLSYRYPLAGWAPSWRARRR